MFLWTDEKIGVLRDLWGAGHSALEIARELGHTSRSAIIGKAHRLGLRPLSVGRKPKKKMKPAKAPVRPAAPAAPMAPMLAAEPLPPPPPVVATKTFDELGRYDCKFPVGDPRDADFGFCGQPQTAGMPYCARCCQIAFVPNQHPRARRAGANQRARKVTRLREFRESHTGQVFESPSVQTIANQSGRFMAGAAE